MLKPEQIFSDRDPVVYFDGHEEHLIYPSDADYCYGPEDFEDWPIDDDRDEDIGPEEDEDEGEAKNEAEQGQVNAEQSEQGLLSTPDSETSTTKTLRQDRQRSDSRSPSPRISGQDIFAAGQHHIWI